MEETMLKLEYQKNFIENFKTYICYMIWTEIVHKNAKVLAFNLLCVPL